MPPGSGPAPDLASCQAKQRTGWRFLAQRRSRSIGNRPRRRSDVNEPGYAFVRCKVKSIEHAAIISVPPGDPVRPIAERMRAEDKVHGGGSGIPEFSREEWRD